MAEFTNRQQDDVSIVGVEGEFTSGNVGSQLRDTVRNLQDNGSKEIVISVADVTRLDSDGATELVSALASTSQRGGSLKLAELSTEAREQLTGTQLLDVFEVFDSEDEAVRSFA